MFNLWKSKKNDHAITITNPIFNADYTPISNASSNPITEEEPKGFSDFTLIAEDKEHDTEGAFERVEHGLESDEVQEEVQDYIEVGAELESHHTVIPTTDHVTDESITIAAAQESPLANSLSNTSPASLVSQSSENSDTSLYSNDSPSIPCPVLDGDGDGDINANVTDHKSVTIMPQYSVECDPTTSLSPSRVSTSTLGSTLMHRLQRVTTPPAMSSLIAASFPLSAAHVNLDQTDLDHYMTKLMTMETATKEWHDKYRHLAKRAHLWNRRGEKFIQIACGIIGSTGLIETIFNVRNMIVTASSTGDILDLTALIFKTLLSGCIFWVSLHDDAKRAHDRLQFANHCKDLHYHCEDLRLNWRHLQGRESLKQWLLLQQQFNDLKEPL